MDNESNIKKLLIVDDDNFFIEFEKAFLQREHFQILEARNGVDALEIIRAEKPDLVLLDLYMPEMGGMEVLVRTRAEGMYDLPIIIVSNEENLGKIDDLKAAGATDFLTKPIKIEALLTTINTHLNEAHRAATRLPTSIKLRYKTLDELLHGESRDLSTTGIFVRTKKELELGSHVELFLYEEAHEDAEPIKLIGEVVRNEQGGDGNAGAGLKFINLEPDSVKMIEKLLAAERDRSRVDVLVVDDDKVIREMLCDAIREAGYRVQKSVDAINALKKIDTVHPSMILADILMPGMTGIEFCETYRKNAEHKDVPFIFISSQVDKDTVMKARASGATFFIAKPFNVPNVLAKIRELLGPPKTPPDRG